MYIENASAVILETYPHKVIFAIDTTKSAPELRIPEVVMTELNRMVHIYPNFTHGEFAYEGEYLVIVAYGLVDVTSQYYRS